MTRGAPANAGRVLSVDAPSRGGAAPFGSAAQTAGGERRHPEINAGLRWRFPVSRSPAESAAREAKLADIDT